jgi:predicted HTH domain antitoxin
MGTRTLTVELPEDLVALLGSPELAAAKAKEALVMELLREVKIGQSKAAELLGVTRGDILDLTVKYRVPSGPLTADEVEQEAEDMRRWLGDQAPRADRQ